MKKLVIFDMDGVMFDTERLLTKYWCRAANEMGFPMKMADALELRSLARRYAEPMLKERFGEEFSYRKVRARRIELMEEHIERNGLKTKPFLRLLLDYLDKNGYKKAIATSTDYERTVTYLQMTGLENRFDVVCCGPSVEHGKPKPDIYLFTVQKLGLRPCECLAVEDSPNGIISAYDAGVFPVLIPDLTQPDPELLKKVYRKCSSLVDIIGVLDTVKYELFY